MKKIHIIIRFLIFPLWGLGGSGTDAFAQDLDTYIQEALRNSPILKQQNLEIEKALESINQARAYFYPRVTFAPTYSLAAGGRKLDFPIGDLLNPVYSTLNQLTKTKNFPQVENVSQLLAPNNFHDTKFTVQYAIYDPQIKYNYLIQKALVSVEEAKKKVIENELRYNVETAYFQYLQTVEAENIFANSHRVLEELVKFNQKLINNQIATKDALFAAEYEVAKLDQQAVVMAKNKQMVAAYLKYLTKKAPPAPREGNINQDFQKALNIEQNSSSPVTPLGVRGLGGGLGTTILKQAISASKQVTEMNEKSALWPSIFAGVNAGFQGFGYNFSGQGYGVMQLGMNWDLFKGHEKKSKIQQSKIQTQILETKLQDLESQQQMQITQAVAELEAAKKLYQLSNAAVVKAEQYYKVVDSQYRNGMKLMIEYLKAQNEVTTAKLQQSVAMYDVLMKKSLLDKVMAQ